VTMMMRMLFRNIANLFVVLVLVFKFTRFQGRLAVVNGTFANAGENLFHFAIVFIVTVMLYSVMGQVVFGTTMPEYRSETGLFLRHLILKVIISPRHAWDKHRKNSTKCPFSCSNLEDSFHM